MIQVYEDYWAITLAYTDINGNLFRVSLSTIVNFIDDNASLILSSPSLAYANLQRALMERLKITEPSTRKAINQFIKLGFVGTGLRSYDPLTKEFLEASNDDNRRTIFSLIVYSNSSFRRSFTEDSDIREISFFVKTLEKNGGCLTKDDTAALMSLDIKAIGVDYADAAVLQNAKDRIRLSGFAGRKYNQVSHFWSILKLLDDLRVTDEKIYFSDDPRAQIVTSDKTGRGRDPYLQRLYKNQLIHESTEHYGGPICMLEKLDCPALIASHIRPYAKSSSEQEFDSNNGLLLSRTMDQLFDSGYISFNDDGSIMVTREAGLSAELIDHLQKYRLDSILLNDARLEYIAYHREYIYKG